MADQFIAFVMDPIERVNVHADTTFALMLGAQEQGMQPLYVAPSGITWSAGKVLLSGLRVTLQKVTGAPVTHSEPITVDAGQCKAIFIRTDPPFDQHYLTATWLLSFAEDAGVRCLNSARGLREANEKLYALRFSELCPTTLVSADKKQIREFISAQKTVVAKPIDGHGGFGVFRLSDGDTNTGAVLDILTHEGKHPIIVQTYLPAGQQGDKRLFVINGKLRAALMRIPPKGDHRGNVHIGGTTAPVEISDHDRAIVAKMSAQLVHDGLLFVGLDVIGDKLIEVNVTSPTLVQELRDHGGPDLVPEILALAH